MRGQGHSGRAQVKVTTIVVYSLFTDVVYSKQRPPTLFLITCSIVRLDTTISVLDLCNGPGAVILFLVTVATGASFSSTTSSSAVTSLAVITWMVGSLSTGSVSLCEVRGATSVTPDTCNIRSDRKLLVSMVTDMATSVCILNNDRYPGVVTYSQVFVYRINSRCVYPGILYNGARSGVYEMVINDPSRD